MLTAQQMKFVEQLRAGGLQSNAYRKAYDTSQMVPKTVREETLWLKKHRKVTTEMIQLQAVSREDRVFSELENIAFGDGPASERLKALGMLGKHIGLFTPKEVPEGDCKEEIKIEMQKAI